MSETNMLVWYGYACLVYKYAAWNYAELPYISHKTLETPLFIAFEGSLMG